jgi:hypothetical protein
MVQLANAKLDSSPLGGQTDLTSHSPPRWYSFGREPAAVSFYSQPRGAGTGSKQLPAVSEAVQLLDPQSKIEDRQKGSGNLIRKSGTKV